MSDLVEYIERLIKLQITLISAFRWQFPDMKDWVFLLDFPKKGSLRIGNDTWHFHKPGAGISFKRNSDAIIVDIHRKLNDPICFDSWRLEQFLESLGFDLEERYEIEDDLKRLAFAGIINQHPDNNGIFSFPTGSFKHFEPRIRVPTAQLEVSNVSAFSRLVQESGNLQIT